MSEMLRSTASRSQLPAATLQQLIAARAEASPSAPALLAPGRAPLSYAGLLRQMEEGLGALNRHAVGPSDRVAVVLPNGPEMAALFLTVAAGAACAPLNPAYRAAEFDFYLADLAPRALVLPAGLASPAREVASSRGIPVLELFPVSDGEAGRFTLAGEPGSGVASPRFAGAEDVALLLHTSGTTARPKRVPLTQRNLCSSAEHVRAALQLSESDRCLNVMPLFHIHGLVAAVLASLAAGAGVVCTPGFYAPHFFDWLDECRPTWYTAVPTMHQAILARARDHQEVIARRPLRLIRSSSAPLPPSVMAALETTFSAPVIEAYGMTEAAHQIASNPLPPLPRKPGSVGAASGPEVAVMDESGRLLPARVTGEVVLRGPNVTPGYDNNPEANRSAFIDGWLRTGDQGYLDEDGYLFLTGRLKEIINRGGEKISPREVDEVLLEHPAVAQVVTFAVPHPALGEEVAAAAVLRDAMPTSEREIRDFAARRLAAHKVPRQVLFLEEIPKGPTGKLQRIGLAERLGVTAADLEAPEEVPFVPPHGPVQELLAELWADVLGPSALLDGRVGAHHRFLHLGGDSMLGTQLVARVRETLQVELPLLSLFEEAATVAGMAEQVLRLAVQPEKVERRAALLLQLAQLSDDDVEAMLRERAILHDQPAGHAD